MDFFDKRITFIDLETTSFNGYAIEMAMKIVETKGIDPNLWDSHRKFFLLNPLVRVGEEASRINGYGEGPGKKPVGTQTFTEISSEFSNILMSSDIIIAQYKKFEVQILGNEYSRSDLPFESYSKFYDLIDLAKRKLNIPSYKLHLIAEALKIEYDKTKLHGGEYDTELTYECFRRLIFMPDIPSEIKKVAEPKINVKLNAAVSYIKSIEKEIDSLASDIVPQLYKIKTKVTSLKEVDESAKKIAILSSLHAEVVTNRRSMLSPIKLIVRHAENYFKDKILAKIEEVQGKLIENRTSFLKKASAEADDSVSHQITAIHNKAESLFAEMIESGESFDKANEAAEAIAATAPEQTFGEKRKSTNATDTIYFEAKIVDKEIVPKIFWSPDIALIQESVNAGNTEIPGVSVEKKIKSSFRR